MATAMTAEMPAAEMRVKKPVRTPKPPPNSAIIASRVKMGGIPNFSSKVLKVPLNPWPPNSPKSFCEPWAMKISPNGILNISGAIRAVASKLPFAMQFLLNCRYGVLLHHRVQQSAFSAALDRIHEFVGHADDFIHAGW